MSKKIFCNENATKRDHSTIFLIYTNYFGKTNAKQKTKTTPQNEF